MNTSRVRALAEVALRVEDLSAMTAFYEDVVGLEVMGRFDTAVFFRIAPGHQGHTQILALFDRGSTTGFAGPDRKRTTVDHLAFSIDREDYDAEKRRLEGLGCEVRTAFHEWVQWRSLYIRDPEENEVEFVCFDPAHGAASDGESEGESNG